MMNIWQIEDRYKDILHLTANENQMSKLANRYYNSEMKNRYKMGKSIGDVFVSGNFAAKAMPEVDSIIERAEEELKAMLSAACVTLNCLSGVHAMMSAILCCTSPGDTVMSVESNHGGHFCTKGLLEMSGRKHVSTKYDYENYTFDVSKIVEECKRNKVNAIYLDTSVLLRPHPIKELREMLGEEVMIIYDASHTLGLIMSGLFQNPLKEGADVIAANTHKTLPGPHHGIIAFRDEKFGVEAIGRMTKSLYSSTHINEVLALCITIFEIKKWGKFYARKIINNANELGKKLSELGVDVRKVDNENFTYSHQLHLFIEKENNKNIVERFLKNNISINTSKALGDKLFIRLGLQEVTRLGLDTDDISVLALILSRVIRGEDVKSDVEYLLDQLNEIHYGFDISDEEYMLKWLNI